MAVRNTLACRKHLNRSPYEEIDNSLLIQEFTEGAFKGVFYYLILRAS